LKDKVPFNYGGLTEEFSSYNNSQIVVLPIPFDKTSTWIKGADKGPDALIQASHNMELYDIETASEVYIKGICTEKPLRVSSSMQMVKKVYSKVSELIKEKKFVVVVGGEHSVSIGAVGAHSESYKNLSVLHLDAHADMRDSYEDNKFSHACFAARSKEVVEKVISVGIRSMDSSELGNIEKDNIFYAEKINSNDWVEKVVEKLSGNVYISIDLDVFDPSIMSSTGTPEPGGLGWYTVLGLLKKVTQNKNVVGFDVVELCPSKYNKAPDFLAAKLIYKLLSYKFA
jgi:agmatinase